MLRRILFGLALAGATLAGGTLAQAASKHHFSVTATESVISQSANYPTPGSTIVRAGIVTGTFGDGAIVEKNHITGSPTPRRSRSKERLPRSTRSAPSGARLRAPQRCRPTAASVSRDTLITRAAPVPIAAHTASTPSREPFLLRRIGPGRRSDTCPERFPTDEPDAGGHNSLRAKAAASGACPEVR